MSSEKDGGPGLESDYVHVSMLSLIVMLYKAMR